MKMMSQLWEKFWFSEGSKINFLIVRWFIFTGGAIFGIFVTDVHPPNFYQFWKPISFYQLFPGPFSNISLETIRWLWIAFSIVAGFGLFYRWTSLIAGFCAVVFLGYNYNFGVVYHSHHMYVMCVAIMALSEQLRHFLGKPEELKKQYYRLSVQWVKCYVVYMFFICGLEKLWYGDGILWAFSESFYLRLWVNPYHPPLTGWILNQPLFVSQIFACIALFLVELAAPLAFLNKKVAVFFVIVWSLFHVGVTMTYGGHVTFFSQIFCYMAFLSWDSFLPQRAKNVCMRLLDRN